MGLFDLIKFDFCDDLVRLIGEHLRTCEHCRSEVKQLIEVPAVKMLLKRMTKTHRKLFDEVTG
jgi:hypothetical protein